MPPPPNSKDLLARFSPSLDFYAVSPGDGRVKIWDTVKGHLQVEFTDLAPVSSDALQPGHSSGHLSIDYTCMEWVQMHRKKARPGNYVLVLGTGGGDVVALDVSGGELKWKAGDCHPGGVSAVSFQGNSLCIITAGVDGMVCQIDPSNGNLLGKFKASTKAISSLSISPDGKMLAIAAGQIKVFNSSDHKKVQKFSGHPASVCCMTFSEDGKKILSSAFGEKFITVWNVDSTKNRSASCVLSMEYPIIYLDCKGSEHDDGISAGFYVLAVSEKGFCYFWHGKDIENLRNKKPTIISLSVPASGWKNSDSAPSIHSAKFQGITTPASAVVLVAHSSTIKPHFEKVNVRYGVDVDISCSQQAAFLPAVHLYENQKDQTNRKKVTMLDRTNAEDAVIPFPKVHGFQDKKRKHDEHHPVLDTDVEMVDTVADGVKSLGSTDSLEVMEEETGPCLEDMLKSEGILCSKERKLPLLNKDSSGAIVDATILKDVCMVVDANRPTKKMSDSILSMFSGDAIKFLEVLTLMWKTRSVGEQSVLQWISHVIVSYGHSIMSQETHKKIIVELDKLTMIKRLAFEPLLNLSGRLQLITAQIDRSVCDVLTTEHVAAESEEDEDDIDEVVFGEEDTSPSSDDFDD